MKKISLYLICISLLALNFSCDTDEKVVDQVLETYTSGAVLRTLETVPDDEDEAFDMFRTENSFSVTVEEQDETEGELIDRVDLTVDYVDNNKDDNDVSVSGVAYSTIPASAFTVGDRGLPSTSFSFTMEEALTTLNIPLTEVLPGDRIIMNLELFFTDGRSFKASDAAVTVTGGSFFSSPFLYSLLIDDGIAFDYEVTTSDEIDLSEGAVVEDYEASISIDDASEGSLLETLNIYRTFRDLTIGDDNINLSEEEALFETYAIADLDLVDGARTLDISYTIEELLGEDLELSDLAVGDDIKLRYEIITTDGRIVTTDENDTEYFFSISTSQCVQLNADGPYAGDYIINMADSYGDGWNGGFLTVTLDGEEVPGSPFRVETGSEATGEFTVPEGATSLTVVYTSLEWDDENTFTILDPNGKKAAVGSFPRTNGQGPIEYPIELKVCE
ncbi:hypothetical protein LCL86_13705 [Muricauda ruestringensis]|uniref:hypothetical protein n=1 Tax=Flagellimonas ruestringensis TaxID=111501 RepID=UPI001CD2D868|nr:hypothetical protein [Allomuricauda ruestringensis]MCA0960107.1 hypothetical protein [Allomuricauda ruestringensis]